MNIAIFDATLNKSFKSLKSTLTLLNEVSIWRDNFTTQHEIRVGKLVNILAREIGLSPIVSKVLGNASCFHDIGKFSVPDNILHKTTALTSEEFEIVKRHSQIGAAIFRKVKKPFCRLTASIALTHHEKMDGSGYPKGLKGYRIPLEGRIIALADVYDALRSHRNYKLAYPHDEAARIITVDDDRTRPEHFDEKVLKAFERCSDRLQEIYAEKDLDAINHTPLSWKSH